MSAVIYARVSSTLQEEGTSIDTQLAACQRYARYHEYEVVALYTDAHTGSEYRERPGLSDLRSRLASGDVDVVIVYALDRLSRDQLHTAVLIDDFEHNGARLELVTEDFEDSSTGRFIRSVKAFAAELEREKIVERTTRGRRARVEAGKPLASGRPLYGYAWGDEEKSHYVIDPVSSRVVVRIYREFLDGASLRSIVKGLDADNIPGPRGGRWNHNTIRLILRHPNYTGNAYGWAWKKPDDTSGNGPSVFHAERAIPLPDGTVPRLIEPDLWERAQLRLDDNARRQPARKGYADQTLLMPDLAVCGHCGYPLYVVKGEGRLHYVCRSAINHHTDCTYHRVMVEILDDAVWDAVRAFFAEPATVRALLDTPPADDAGRVEMQALERAINASQRRRQNLIQDLAGFDDPDSRAAVRQQIEAYTAQLRTQRAELDALTARQQRWELAADERRELLAWCDAVAANIDSLDLDERRLVVRSLGVKGRIYRRPYSRHPPVYSVDEIDPTRRNGNQ